MMCGDEWGAKQFQRVLEVMQQKLCKAFFRADARPLLGSKPWPCKTKIFPNLSF
jgi:hypothetical protein